MTKLKTVEELKKLINSITEEDLQCCDSFGYLLQEYESNLKYARELEKKEARIKELESQVDSDSKYHEKEDEILRSIIENKNKQNVDLCIRIKELEEANKWRDVCEKLPKKSELVLCWIENIELQKSYDKPVVMYYNCEKECFHNLFRRKDGFMNMSDILTHWRYINKPEESK